MTQTSNATQIASQIADASEFMQYLISVNAPIKTRGCQERLINRLRIRLAATPY